MAQARPLTDAEAEAIDFRLRRALDTARQQGARLYELRAATSLARWLAERGHAADARTILTAAIQGIPDQTPTRDLEDAQRTLTQL